MWGENEIDHVLVAQKDVELALNKEEVHEVRYCTYNELMEVGVYEFDDSMWYDMVWCEECV